MKSQDDILSYWEMCDLEGKKPLQRGMNFRWNPQYSVILMSQRKNAPYHDSQHLDGRTIEYEGHDVNRSGYAHDPKSEDQPAKLPSGTLTQNGKFIQSIEEYIKGNGNPEPVKVYDKIANGIWSLKGMFDLIDYKVVRNENRKVFRFILTLSKRKFDNYRPEDIQLEHTRLIPTEIKIEVWKRDDGKCRKCGETQNLHYDHDLPFSKGGTSLTGKNVQLLCMKHNLQKSDKIE